MNCLFKRTTALLFFVGVTAVTQPAAAQERPISIGVGYQHLKFEDSSFPVGVNADVAVGIIRHVALVGELGWGRHRFPQFGLRTTMTALSGAAGVRLTTSEAHRFRIFGQLLAGFERDKTDIEKFGADIDSSPALEPGGGVAIRAFTRVDVFGQIDWRRLFKDDGGANAVRFIAGVRLAIH